MDEQNSQEPAGGGKAGRDGVFCAVLAAGII